GLPAPIDVQGSGFNAEANRAYAQALLARLHRIPGVVDLRIQQAFDYPQLNVEVDRSKAALLGLSETDVASDLLVSLSGSSQTTLSFWIDPKSGTQYAIAAQTPQFRLASLGDLATTPVTGGGAAGGASGGGRAVQLLANLASFHRSVAPAVVSHYDATPVVDIFGAVEGSDLGFVAAQIQRVLAESKSSLPRGSQVAVHGQVKTMTESFAGLLLGLAAAIVLVYLLIVVNFQSWLDPFIIITALARRDRRTHFRDRGDALLRAHRVQARPRTSEHLMAELPTVPHSVLADARVRRYALIGLAAALVLAVWGIVSRISARNALER